MKGKELIYSLVGRREVYKDGVITAGNERSSDTGFTLIDTDGIDLDGIVGIGGLTIDLSSNADAGFWAAGSQYTVIIGPVTVDAAVINFIPVTFRIGYDGAFRETVIESVTSQTALVLAAGVAPPDDNAFNGCRAIIHDVATADQWSFVDVIDYDAGTRTITLAAGAIFTVVATDNISFFPPALHATRATVLDDWINDGRLDVLLDAVNTVTPDAAGVAPTAGEIADAVQDEPIEDHDTQGNVGWATALAVYMGPDGPGIYIDSGAANTNTVVGTDGTAINPVSTFAAARTIANALGIKIYYLEGNSDITLAATHEDWEFIGLGSVRDNVVNLGSQDVDRSLFRNLTIEGTQGGTGRITARDCALQDPGAGTTTLHIFAERCGIVDDILVDTSADNVFDECYSLAASGVAPIITATGASGSIIISHYGGKLELKSLSASHNIELDGNGHITFNADCNVNANIDIHGIWDVTDNTAGMSDLTPMTGLVNMTKINTEADTALADYDGPTEAEMNTGHGLLATEAKQDIMQTAIDAIKAITDQFVFTVANLVDSNMKAISDDQTAADNLEALIDSLLIITVNDASATITAFAADGFTEAVDDIFKGRLMTFLDGANQFEQTDITGYDAADGPQGAQEFTVTALTAAPAEDVNAIVH